MTSDHTQHRNSSYGLDESELSLAVHDKSRIDVDALDAKLEAIERELGEPSYSAPGVRIFGGDCLDLMDRLVRRRIAPFDLTVTSPPYNIGKEYETHLPVTEYIKWCGEWIDAVFSITMPRGAFWLNLGYLQIDGRAKAIPIPYLLWDKVPFYLLQEIVWNYGAGVAARKTFSPRNEKFLWYVKDPNHYTFNLDSIRDPDVKYPQSKRNGKLRTNPLGKNPTDVWQIPKITSGANRSSKERTTHPAQFPTAVVERIVKGCSVIGDLVLDPFIGSGTVAEVCMRNGRACVGIEIEPRYVELAAQRLEVARTQAPLFR